MFLGCTFHIFSKIWGNIHPVSATAKFRTNLNLQTWRFFTQVIVIKAKSLQLIFKLFRIGFKKQIKCLDIKKEVFFSYVRKILYFICGIENFEGTGGIFFAIFFLKKSTKWKKFYVDPSLAELSCTSCHMTLEFLIYRHKFFHVSSFYLFFFCLFKCAKVSNLYERWQPLLFR